MDEPKTPDLKHETLRPSKAPALNVENVGQGSFNPPFLSKLQVPGLLRVESGPEQVRSEWRYRVKLKDGSFAVLFTLAPELAKQEALRRRYIKNIHRLQAMSVPGLCPILATGPEIDQGFDSELPPWRLRSEPRHIGAGGAVSERPLSSLQDLFDQDEVLGIDTVVSLVKALAEIVKDIHKNGWVLRDFGPQNVLIEEVGPPSKVWLCDIGLTQVDRLSTQTAASLMLSSSPYNAPEQMLRAVVDQRSDLYTLAMMLFVGLTGQRVSKGRGHSLALSSEQQSIPRVKSLRPEVPKNLDVLVDRGLQWEPQARPESVAEFLRVLAGEKAELRSLERVQCQNCGARMLAQQRLCLQCGKEGVVLSRAGKDQEHWVVELTRISEKGDEHRRLVDTLQPLVNEEIKDLNFIIGDIGLYSKDEAKGKKPLPANLFDDVDEKSAKRIVEILKSEGFEVRAGPKERLPVKFDRKLIIGTILYEAFTIAFFVFMTITFRQGRGIAWGFFFFASSLMPMCILFIAALQKWQQKRRIPVFFLRRAPAALPASDPWVARLSSWLSPDKKLNDDLRAEVGEMALLVQRLVDHRAGFKDKADAAHMQWVSEPVEELIDRLEALLERLHEIHQTLDKLDENGLIRAIAQSEARDEPKSARESLLLGLDRIADLRQEYSALFGRLLESGALLRRAVNLGLRVRDEQREHEVEISKALALLSAPPALPAGE